MSCPTDVCGTGNWVGPKPGDPDNGALLSATPAFGGIDVSWTYPTINPHAVAHTVLYRGTSSNYALAVQQAVVAGNSFYDRITGPDNTQYYYWIRIVSVNGTEGTVIGPASAIARSRSQDLIGDLSGKLENSALGTDLRTSIGKITLNYDELVLKIASYSGNDAAFIAALSALQSGMTGALTLLNTETTERIAGQNALVVQHNVLAALNVTNAAAITEEALVRVTLTDALATRVSAIESSGGSVSTAIRTVETTKIGYSGKVTTEEPYEGNATFVVYPAGTYPSGTYPDYAANRTRIIDKQGVTNWNAGNTQQLVWVVGLPLAQAFKSIGISDGAAYLTVEQRATAQKLTNGTLLGKFTVKVDQGGRVAGFGLASSSNLKDGTTSAMAVNSDTFSVARPLSFSQATAPSATSSGQTWFNESNQLVYKATAPGTGSWVLDVPRYPFIVDTVSGDVLIDNAIIRKLTADSIDTTNLTIKNAAGTVIFGAGTLLGVSSITGLGSLAIKSAVGYTELTGTKPPADADKTSLNISAGITGQGTFATKSGLGYSEVTGVKPPSDADHTASNISAGIVGQGALATQSSVDYTSVSGIKPPSNADRTASNTAAGITGQGALATLNSVKLGSNVTFPDGSIINSTDLVSKLSKINTSTIGTFVDGLAITNAYIGNAEVSTLKIAGNAVTIPVGSTGWATIPEHWIWLDEAGPVFVTVVANAMATGGSNAGNFYVAAACNYTQGPLVGVSLDSSFSGSATAIGKFNGVAGSNLIHGSAYFDTNGGINRSIGITGIFGMGIKR